MESKIGSSRFFFLFRFFYPSWRFFENFEHYPELSFRFAAQNAEEWGPWILGLPKMKRSLFSLFSNPKGNELLAYASLLDQLEGYIESVSDAQLRKIEETTVYQILKNYIEFQIKSQVQFSFKYQFKIAAKVLDSNINDEYLHSPTYEVETN